MAFVGFGREEGGVTGLVLDVDIPRPAPTSADAMESTMCSPDDHDGADIAIVVANSRCRCCSFGSSMPAALRLPSRGGGQLRRRRIDVVPCTALGSKAMTMMYDVGSATSRLLLDEWFNPTIAPLSLPALGEMDAPFLRSTWPDAH